MDLAFGTRVREHGYVIGRLAGLEADSRTHVVRHLLITVDGTLRGDLLRRPLDAVPADHFDGEILLLVRPDDEAGSPSDVFALTPTTPLVRKGRQIGWLSGVELSPLMGGIISVVGRQHWWTRRFHVQALDLDFSIPGEIRVNATTSEAA